MVKIVVEWVKVDQTIVAIVVLFILLILALFLTPLGIIPAEAGKWLAISSLQILIIIVGYKLGSKAMKTYQETKKLSTLFGTKKEWLIVMVILAILFGSIVVAGLIFG
jgi:hypothetical protein